MDRWMPTLLLAHLLATAMMAGVIWFVQVVHYPLFGAVPADGFVAYERSHVARTGTIVGPLMLLEAATCVALVLAAPAGVPRWMPWAGAGLLAVVWLSTFAVQVPLHRRLEGGLDPDVVRRLVGGNWIRTVGWTARALLAAWMIAAFIPGRASPAG